MNELFSSIGNLQHVGKKRQELYHKMGIRTPYDLLCHYPRYYIDISNPKPIGSYPTGVKGVVKATVVRKSVSNTGRYTIYKSFMEDYFTKESFMVTIFNNSYADDKLILGRTYVLQGKIDLSFNEEMPQINSPMVINAYNPIKLQAVYRLTGGLTKPMVQDNMRQALELFDRDAFDIIDMDTVMDVGLIPLQQALHWVHFPTCKDDMIIARRRLAFDEILLLQIGMEGMKRLSKKSTGCTMHNVDISDFVQNLPFDLTDGQTRAMYEVMCDLRKSTPMNRLIQGDVGSGKTMVAMFACYFASRNGFQSAMMVPTEILAQQHFATFKEMLEPTGIKVGLLTGSLTAKQKKAIRQQIADGELDVIVGTHALIQKDTNYYNLGLVITDEQHRFGVAQRSELAHKGNYPHRLVMSATPIPRTLGLIIYGDLDISTINELPKGRQPVETFAVSGKLRQRAYNYVIKHLKEGGQAYIVCPTIEENELDLQSVYEYYDTLSKGAFKDYRLSILHGKMSSEEKEAVMLDFKEGRTDVLVSTTVIEVGVDVPNATIIIIENADRFGLSQLHQLRGRVGRGSKKGSCILITDNVNPDTKSRLRVLCSTNDGFKIAEEDLEIRGCGDFFGQRQHGLPSLKIADLVNDMDLVECARNTAYKILNDDPNLQKLENLDLKLAVIDMFESTM